MMITDGLLALKILDERRNVQLMIFKHINFSPIACRHVFTIQRIVENQNISYKLEVWNFKIPLREVKTQKKYLERIQKILKFPLVNNALFVINKK